MNKVSITRAPGPINTVKLHPCHEDTPASLLVRKDTATSGRLVFQAAGAPQWLYVDREAAKEFAQALLSMCNE